MLLKRAGVITDIELQPVYTLMEGRLNKATGKKVSSIKYKADFLITYADGHQEIEDVKGYKTAVYQLKKRMFMIKFPDLQIREISA